MVLSITGCAPQPTLTPTAIPRADSTEEDVDLSHLPEATMPTDCAGYVSLTFDDGPTEVTGDILAVLDHYEVPAAFFNIGSQEQTHPRLVERQLTAGHQVGNHTMTHPDLLSLDLEAALADVDAASVTHTDLSFDDHTLFRPPFGNTSAELREGVEERSMLEVLWTVDSKDYEATTAEQVVEASKGMTDGGILLLHDGKPTTVEALPSIITHYFDQGLCFGQITATDTEITTDLPGFTHRARATEQES